MNVPSRRRPPRSRRAASGDPQWNERSFQAAAARGRGVLPGRDQGTQHLTFGHGIHFCLGAHFARMEARLALEACVPRIRAVKLRSPDLQWRPGLNRHGPWTLPVECIPA